MTTNREEKKDPVAVPITISLGVNGLIFLFLFLFNLRTPLPPFPILRGGLEVALGNEDIGMGNDPVNPPGKNKSSVPPPSPDDQKIITNDAEDNNVTIPPNKKVKDKTVVKPSDKPVDKPAPTPVDDELTKMLKEYNSKSKTSGGHGDDKTPGSKGDPNGTPGSTNYSGVPGNNGPGKDGPGNSKTGAQLRNRHLIVPATLVSNEQEEGTVVVEITVDQNGNVISAESRAKGSTTTSPGLWAKARQAALKAKFDKSPDGTPEQKGTYIFNFSFK